MHLNVTNEIINKPPPDKYCITITVMHGDGDGGYDNVLIYHDNQDTCLSDYELFLRVANEFNDHLERNYCNIKEVFGEEKADYISDLLPMDITSDYNWYASIEDITISYFNDYGEELHVEVIDNA